VLLVPSVCLVTAASAPAGAAPAPPVPHAAVAVAGQEGTDEGTPADDPDPSADDPADPADPGAGGAPGDTRVPTPDIIPRPNSGKPPEDADDRGGALQLGLLGLIVLAVGGMSAKVVHDSRRARRESAPSGRD